MMGNETLPDVYHALPKVDLHRHLEGSLRLSTLREIARRRDYPLPDTGSLPALVQVQPEDPPTVPNFLAKFQILRQFYRSPQIIQRLTEEVVEDAAADNVVYLELHFTPVALTRQSGFSLAEVMDWVCASARQAAARNGVTVGLIASANRHEDPTLAAEVVDLALTRREQGIVGVGLAGNEAEFDAAPFASIFQTAHAQGMRVTIHAGEWGGAANVRQAVEDLQADRIGHGVRVLEDPAVIELARQRGAAFEVCLTSNIQTGVVPRVEEHPLPAMLAAGLNVSLHTDDPAISGITLSGEYQLACETLGLPMSALKASILAAASASFLPRAEKERLLARLRRRLVGAGDAVTGRTAPCVND